MTFRLVKQKVFPKPHDIHMNFNLSADDTDFNNQATFIPVLYNDDAMSPSTYYANPQHASFAEDTQGGCYPESKVYSISGKLTLSLTKEAWNTDKLRNLEVVIIPVHTAFLEDLTPKDDLTGETIESLLELQHETTDRQTYPIYAGTKLNGAVLDVGSRQQGLTTNTNIENISFDLQKLYDALHYYTIKGKVRKLIGGIMHRNLTITVTNEMAASNTKNKGGGAFQFKLRLPSKTKAINPYTFLGFIIYIPKCGLESKYNQAGDTTDIDHVTVDFRCRYNEWNDGFNFERA